MQDDAPPPRWLDALAAASLLAIDPVGLGGAHLVAGPGPVRDGWIAYLRGLLPEKTPFRRVPVGIDDDRLLGGVDLAATLERGAIVAQRGVLAEADGGFVVLAMAERLAPATAARIAEALDRHVIRLEREGLARQFPTRFAVVAVDEREPDESPPPRSLIERLAFHVELNDVPVSALTSEYAICTADEIAVARRRLTLVEPPADSFVEALAAVALRFGLFNLNMPFLAMRAACAAAALDGRTRITEEDALIAARLVLAPRALMAPSAEEPESAPEEPPPEPPSPDETPAPVASSLSEWLIEAAAATLPSHLINAHEGCATRRENGARAGTGRMQKEAVRGRRICVRAAKARDRSGLALVATLRAAAPWQNLRRRAKLSATEARIEVRRDDFRVHRFAERRESTIIFVVDASGSAALHRLAEAKGAVQLLLGEAYTQRTSAALIVFRGQGAELLLPPTRSLARAKNLLAALPGGGATPLAAGLSLALTLALAERRKGRDPTIVVLSDGRANMSESGAPGRSAAMEEARAAARAIGESGARSVFIDTSPRPNVEAAALAALMRGRYEALPYVEAKRVREALRAVA
jgi:magnesium chelatase subunit D